jgi:FixJ family two-component response regulator
MAQDRGKGIVIVADDDARARRAMMAELTGAGYNAVGYADARGALAHLALGERADALVTGVALPGPVDGIGLALEAGASRPTLPVIYVSDRGALEPGSVPEGALVAKPLRAGDIRAAVDGRLAPRPRRAA